MIARVAVVYSGRPGAKATFATQVIENLKAGAPVNVFSDQICSPTLAENAAEMLVELLTESRYQGVIHTTGATVLNRMDFATRLARRFGLDPEGLKPILTADVKLPAHRPLRGGLRVERAAKLLNHKPLAVEESLARFQRDYEKRPSA